MSQKGNTSNGAVLGEKMQEIALKVPSNSSHSEILPIKYVYKGYQITIFKKNYGFNSAISHILPTGISQFIQFVAIGIPSIEDCKKITETRVDFLLDNQ